MLEKLPFHPLFSLPSCQLISLKNLDKQISNQLFGTAKADRNAVSEENGDD